MNTPEPRFRFRAPYFPFLLVAAALLLPPAARAEVVGIENFGYASGDIAGKDRGTYWDWSENTPAPKHTGTASNWDDVTAGAWVRSGALITSSNQSAKREFNGPSEGVTAPSDERDGAFNGDDAVFFRVTMTRRSDATWSGLSSYDFGAERIFFGVPGAANPDSGKREFGIQLQAPFTGTTNWSTAVRLGSGGSGDTAWDHLQVATTWEEVGPHIPNASFEADTFTVAPGYVNTGEVINNDGEITGWSHSGRVGLNPSAGSPFADNGAIPEGSNVAFIQSLGGVRGSLSTTITGLVPGTHYKVSVRTNSRVLTAKPEARWRLNGGDFVELEASPKANFGVFDAPYHLIQNTFLATSTIAGLEFRNETNADTTLLIDDVRISVDPNVFLTSPDGSGGFTIDGYDFDGDGNKDSIEGPLVIPATIRDTPVTGIGKEAFHFSFNLTALTLPDSLTSIGVNAFRNCSNLKSVTLPDGLKDVGNGAFALCSGLTSLTLPDSLTDIGVNAFLGCSGLTELTLPTGLKSIGDGAFSACRGLTAVSLPNGLTSIGNGPFSLCESLTTINVGGSNSSFSSHDGVLYNKDRTTLLQFPCGKQGDFSVPPGVTSIASNAFAFCNGLTVNLPDGLKSIGDSAFSFCKGLTAVTLPDSLTSIGERAFEQCSDLKAVTLSDSLISIGDFAFSNTALTAVTLPRTLTSIGESVFARCPELTSVTLPETLTSIGKNAFSICPSLTAVYFLGDAPSLGDGVFSLVADGAKVYYVAGTTGWGATFGGLLTEQWEPVDRGVFTTTESDGKLTITSYDPDRDGNKDCPVGELVIPTSIGGKPVAAIGARAFQSCSGLTSVTLPDGLTSIGDAAFSFCSGLTLVTLPDTLTSIGESAFENCSRLTSLPLPETLTTIGNFSFFGCSGLTSLTVPKTLTSIGAGAFAECDSLTAIGVADGNVNYRSDDGVLYDANRTTLLQFPSGKAGTFSVPASVTSIGAYAFQGCGGLTAVTLPDRLESIGTAAFNGCSGLTAVTLPDSVNSIGDAVFSGCSGLTSVTLPEGVTSIPNFAFLECIGLTSVTLPTALTSIGNRAFFGCSSLMAVFFLGDAPSLGEKVFSGVAAEAKAYYVQGATGFTPEFGGLLTALWDPPVQTGVDLDLIIHATGPDTAQLEWDSTAGERFEVFHSTDLKTWNRIATVNADNVHTVTVFEGVDTSGGRGYYRVRRLP